MPVLTPQLPPKLTDVAGDDRTSKAIAWISQRWRLKNAEDFLTKGASVQEALSRSQAFMLSQTAGEVLTGRLHPNFVVKILQERLQIPQERARDIAHDVSREIFSRVRQELMEYYRITPQQKVAHPQSAELRRPDAEERRQEEPVKPSMLQSAESRRPDAEERRQEEPVKPSMERERSGIRDQEAERGQAMAEPQTQPETQSKPSLAEQVEEGAFPKAAESRRPQSAELRRPDADLRRNEDEAEKAAQAPEPTVPAPKAHSAQEEPKPPEPFDDTQGKHFEPGPEQVIDLR